MRKLLILSLLSFFLSAISGTTFSTLCGMNGQQKGVFHALCADMAEQDKGDAQKAVKTTSISCCCIALVPDISQPALYMLAQSDKVPFFLDTEPESNIPDSPYKPPNFM